MHTEGRIAEHLGGLRFGILIDSYRPYGRAITVDMTRGEFSLPRGRHMTTATTEQFAVYSQDYRLLLDENGPGDVKQQATGPVQRFAPLFPSRAAARKFLKEVILPDARAERYQSEYWIGPYPPRKRAGT